MKQVTLLALVLVTTCAHLTAQTRQFKFGLQLSPSFSWMGTDDGGIDGNGTATGLKLATQAEVFFAENYALTTGIGFHFNAGGTLQSQYAGRFFTESILADEPFGTQTPTGNVSLDYSIRYVEIPVSLKLRTREFGYLTYYLEAPIFSLGIRANATGEISGGGEAAVLEDLDIKREVNPLALSWGFGGGAEYSVSDATRLFGGLQFQQFFTDITRDKDYSYVGRRDSGSDPKARLNMLTVKLGVLF